MSLIEQAREQTAPALAHLRETFGDEHIEVVYVIQRRDGQPVKIGAASNLPQRVAAFLNGCPDPVLFHAVLPGGQPLEHYLHRRFEEWRVFGEWYEPVVIEDAVELAGRQADAFRAGHRLPAATVEAIREHDMATRDLDRLLDNGMGYADVAALAGMSARDVRDRCQHLRAIGFPLGHRSEFAARSVSASRSPRYDTPTRGVRRIG